MRRKGETETRRSFKEMLDAPRFRGLVQFVKFGLVGVSNTLINYGIEMLCYYALFSQTTFQSDTLRVIVSSVLAFAVSVSNAYFWNSRFVFKSGERRTFRQGLFAYLRTVLCYGVTGLALAPAIKVWLTGAGIGFWLASLLSLVVTIPLNFVLNKFWAFGERKS